MKNIEHMTLEQLEKDVWPEPGFQSNLTMTCYELRKKELSKFTVEDLRIMLGQSIGAKYLLPMAIKILKENPFADGDFYEGDLLDAISRHPKDTHFLTPPEKEILAGACEVVLASNTLPVKSGPQVEELLQYIRGINERFN
ncbi:contact-dependent growth inhibition system immunity protein [Rhodovulum sp. FJ3]|uniref:contact-dependent growth inhibition system immunity protein n=1 Tax=Rhodovulum sp. FJ3 TaxID=3079053 RepID=UPI00293DA515|nr:contact-dependent growth inhibition system immunity protein [Rhodovulum sp. FJ3]MDV4169294.1 contact-dependent growth inhibition system immunity protein [Rhodovulum sp. FJ3]